MKYFLQAKKVDKVLVLGILIIGISSTKVAGQDNARATLHISTGIIKSSNIELNNPKKH